MQKLTLFLFFVATILNVWKRNKNVFWQRYIASLIIGVTIALGSMLPAKADSLHTAHTDIDIYSDNNHELIAAITPHQGWHIYWQNPGDIGQPTTITPKAGNIQIINQSTPKKHIAYEIMREYFYDDTAYYKLYIPQMNETVLTFKFTECRDVCRPRKLNYDLADLQTTSAEQWHKIEQQAELTFPKKIKIYSPMSENLVVLKGFAADTLDFVPATAHLLTEDSLLITPKGKKWLISWQTEDPNKRLTQALFWADEKAYLADIIYTGGHTTPLLYILLLAFLGGIILNAMPCVFPILSLKIFTLLQTAQKKGRWRRALSYTAGVLGSFLLLTAFLVILKKQGEAIGWGFQLQSPWFVGAMAIIFILLFLFMMEWIRFPNFANNFTHRAAGLNDFTTGFFAVLIASPCTGPFMGAAVGYAFMQSNAEIFAVFTALAFGYALPYALIELYPQTLSRLLPKPGAWMHKVKILLSIPVLLTALWLLWVLATQLHTDFKQSTKTDLQWQPYDVLQIENLTANGENIFIDFTAKWCLTCQFNDKFMLQSEAFKHFIQKHKVHLFKADLTEDNDIYNSALSSYGRDGIPVYIYYHDGKYEILPVFFTIAQLEKVAN